MRFVGLLLAMLFGASAFAASLDCDGGSYDSIRATIVSSTEFSDVSSSNGQNRQYISELSLKKAGAEENLFSTAIGEDNCEFYLPTNLTELREFEADLRCFDGNNVNLGFQTLDCVVNK